MSYGWVHKVGLLTLMFAQSYLLQPKKLFLGASRARETPREHCKKCKTVCVNTM